MHSWIWLVNFLVLATQLPVFSQSTDATDAAVLASDKIRRTRPDTKYLIRARLTSTEKHRNGGVQMQGEGSCDVAPVLR